MSQQAIATFADELLQHFPPYRQWEDYQEKAWAETLAKELSSFTVAELTKAKREMIRTRKPKDARPPMVSECISACNEARRWLDLDANKGKGRLLDSDDAKWAVGEWSKDRKILANSLIRTQQGRQAAKEGWIDALWTFIRKNGRVPAGHEVEQCKRRAKGFDETYQGLVRNDNPTSLDREWIELGDFMLDRRKKLEAEALR